jgi:hypothetical protein
LPRLRLYRLVRANVCTGAYKFDWEMRAER